VNWITPAQAFLAAVAFLMGYRILRLDPRSSLNQKVSLSCLLVGLYELAGSLAAAAPSALFFWTFLQLSSTLFLLVGPVNLASLLDLSGLRRRWHLAFVVPSALLALVQIVQVWTKNWVISGFHPTVWGNVYEITTQSFPLALNQITTLIGLVVGLSILIHAWFHSRSKRYRGIIAQVFLMSLLANAWGVVSIAVFLVGLHHPDPTGLGAGIILLWYAFLIERYQHLSERRPDMSGPLLASMTGLSFFVGTKALVIKATPEAAQLFEGGLTDRGVFDILKGWPGLPTLWDELKSDLQPKTDLAGQIGSGRFRLHLYPHRNPFDEFDGVLVRLQPEGNLDGRALAYGLSAREHEVARLVCEGLDTKQIAEALFISISTVKNHLHSLYTKTNTASRSELVSRLLIETGPA